MGSTDSGIDAGNASAAIADDDGPLRPHLRPRVDPRADRPYSADAPPERQTSDAECAEARAALLAALPRIAGREWRFRVRIAETPWLRIDARDGSSVQDDGAGGSVDCSLRITPLALLQVLRGDMDPRYAMLYDKLRVEGDIARATLICDALAGRHYATSMPPTELPRPTSDLRLARAQLDTFGYCLIADALTPAQVGSLRARLLAQAQAEREIGRAWLDGDPAAAVPPNQRVWNLINKGEEFVALLDNPLIDAFMTDLLGDHFLLSSYQANIAGPGGQPMFLHNDQISIQPPLANTALGFNFLWFLDDVSPANGGTRILPGSHLGTVAPSNVFTIDGTIGAEGPAGTVLLTDSRVWHGTGPNRTQIRRHVLITYFVRWWARTVENQTLSLRPEVLETLSPRVRTMCGFRCTASLGGVDGPIEGALVSQQPDVLGELSPRAPLDLRV